MTSIRLRLSRRFGGFWWRRRDGWYGRFVESGAYPVAIDLAAAGGFACVLAVLGYAAFERSLATVGWSVLTVAAYLLTLVFLTSFGASVTQAKRHEGSPAELLARCKAFLQALDFRILAETTHSIEVTRGAGAGAEARWRNFPLELSATVSGSDGGSMISVRCTGESGRHRFVRDQILKTAQAAANLDEASLKSLDKALVRRPGAIFQGGLGTMVLAAMLACAALSSVALVGASYLLATYVYEVSQANAAADEMRRMQLQLTSGIDAALRAEAERLAAGLEKTGSTEGAPGDRLRSLAPFQFSGELIAGTADPQGKISFFLRPADSQWTEGALTDARTFGLARVGSMVVRELPQPQARGLEARLGLKPGRLILAGALRPGDLARFAPERLASESLEITFFDSSVPFLRYTWLPGKELQVDAGGGALPADVLASAEGRLESDWTQIFHDVLFGGDIGGIAVRREMRGGAPVRVYYSVAKKEGRGDAWDGVSVARPDEPLLEMRDSVFRLAVALALLALLPVLIVTVALASVISNRISRPALQVRDALRSIAEGDYSVRVQSGRSDEIGQLQDQLNRTAEQLSRRK